MGIQADGEKSVRARECMHERNRKLTSMQLLSTLAEEGAGAAAAAGISATGFPFCALAWQKPGALQPLGQRLQPTARSIATA